MTVKTQRIASISLIIILIPLLLFLNLLTGITLFSFGILTFIAGLLLILLGIFIWLFSENVNRSSHFSPFGLYLVYDGLFLLLLGVISIILYPITQALIPPFVSPE